MNIELQSLCIICNHPDFETINSFPHFPVMAISNDTVKEIFFDFNIILCKKCKCLQLQNRVDPAILYSDVYMNASFSPSWSNHHANFSAFILSNTTESSFLEVGANKGDLYKNLSKERTIEYTTLDMFKHSELPDEIKYVHGNCETFNYAGFDSIILSHVFEHLYSPLRFIENLRNANVKNVFISIPNFDQLLEEKSLLLINSQHTYYCGYDYIVYMFSTYNYTCENVFFYNGSVKSSMFKFVLDSSISKSQLPCIDIQLIKDIYVHKIREIKSLAIPPNSYIMPAGMYGQFIYRVIEKKENVIGFLDNNPDRHTKKLYGTDKYVYLPNSIDYTNVTIVICECPYREELIAGIKSINNHVNMLCL